jgi:hypothetical protein
MSSCFKTSFSWWSGMGLGEKINVKISHKLVAYAYNPTCLGRTKRTEV